MRPGFSLRQGEKVNKKQKVISFVEKQIGFWITLQINGIKEVNPTTLEEKTK